MTQDYPTRKFTAKNAWDIYTGAVKKDKRKRDIAAKIHQMYMLTNSRYRGSSASSFNQNYIKGLGTGTSAGLSSRLKMMTEMDKESVAQEFTVLFQNWQRNNPNGTVAEFNKAANEWGPWYTVELRSKHTGIVLQQEKESSRKTTEGREIAKYDASLLEEDEKDAVASASNALANSYAGRYRSQGAGAQSQVLAELQREIDDSQLPSELKGAVFMDTLKQLKDAYGFKGDVKAAIKDAEDKALQKKRAERKWNLGDKHPEEWWADEKATMVFRELMEQTKDIETDFERAQEIQKLKRKGLMQGTFAGIDENRLDSLLASAGFPNQPYTSASYNQLMERKQLIENGRFDDAYLMYDREFSQDPAFDDWQANARESGIYKIMGNLVPNWRKISRKLPAEWEAFRKAELVDADNEPIKKSERDKKTMDHLEKLARKYKVSPRFIYWALTKDKKSIWGIGAVKRIDI